MESYLTPSKTHRSEIEIKRSRFITTVGKTRNKDHAKHFINEQRCDMPDANHHSWAMVAGEPADIYQQDQSDDGEPKGTAGKPMLNVLRHSGMGNIVVVVTRYFGGVKLGSGGLVRAYTQSVTEAIKTLAIEKTYIRTQVNVALPYSTFDSFLHGVQSMNIEVMTKQFHDNVEMKIAVPESGRPELVELLNKLGGTLQPEQT